MKKVLFPLLILLFFSITIQAEKKITIFMIGDSTMANKDTSNNKQERGWGMMLTEYFTSNVLIDNHAKNGRSTKSFRDEGLWNIVMERIQPGDYVIIQFGHNDEKIDKEKVYADVEVAFPNNLRRYVQESRKKGGIPILCSSIVRRNYDEQGRLVDTHGSYINAAHMVSQEMNVPLLDMTSMTKALVVSLGIEKSKDIFMWMGSKQDNTHLNVKGGRLVARLGAQLLYDEVPALRPYIVIPEINY